MSSATALARLCGVGAIPLFLYGCYELDVPPAGSYSEVIVVSEDGGGDYFARELGAQLGRRIDYYVDEDVQFKVRHVRASALADSPLAAKNVVICGVANPTSDVGRQIVALLGETAVEQAETGRATVFKKADLPGPGQLTVVVTAGSNDRLDEVIRERGGEVAGTIEASCRERLRAHLLKKRQRELTESLQREYGFRMQVPTLYRRIGEEAEPPGLELLRDGPARLLGVFWLDWDHEPTLEDSLTLYEARRRYVWARYDGDTMDSTRVRFDASHLGEYPAVRMEGYWSNSRSVAGGYYKTFYVWEKRERLLWAVDLLVFAPGQAKHPLFRELLALAETFRYD